MEDLRSLSSEVDDFIVDRLHLEDEDLAAVLAASEVAGLPRIAVSASHGALLELLVVMSGASRVLAVVARDAFALAGVEHRVDLREGLAATTLAAMVDAGEAPFDLIFIDADKESNPTYVRRALELSRPGTVLYVDNVVRDGAVLDASSVKGDVVGTRAMFDQLSAEGRIRATAIQTLGTKGYDGFLLGVVVA